MAVISDRLTDGAKLGRGAQIVFYARGLRDSVDGDAILTQARIPVPVDPETGLFTTPNLEPGPYWCGIKWAAAQSFENFQIVIGDSDTRLWPLLEEALPYTPAQESLFKQYRDEVAEFVTTAEGLSTAQDAAVADLVAPGTATKAALDDTYAPLTFVDVEAFRNVGGTDASDDVCIQKAIAFAKTLGIGRVRLTKSSYICRKQINFAGVYGLVFDGLGREQTTVTFTGTLADNSVMLGAGFTCTGSGGGCGDITFRSFTVQGTLVDDTNGIPRRSRTKSGGGGVAQPFSFRGDLQPTATGDVNPSLYPISNIRIDDVTIKNANQPWLLSGIRGDATVTNTLCINTMDASWIFCDIVEAHNLTSVNSADNAFSFSRGNKCVNFSNLTAINPAYYAVWISGFRTSNPGTDGPSWPGPQNVTGSGVIGKNCGMGGLLLDDAPRNGTVTGVMIDGVQRGPSDERSALGGVGIRFGGFPSNDRVSPTQFANNFSVSDFVLIDCAKGGVQPTGSMDCSVHDGKIINCGSEFTEDDSTVISSTDTTQNFGIGTAGIEAGTVVRFSAYNVKVIDTRSTPRTNYPLYLEGAVNAEWFNVTGHGTRRTAASDRVATERRMLGSTIFESMLTLPSGLRSGANAATGTVRGSDVNGAGGSRRQIGQALTAGVSRWEVVATGDAESGSNAGSNYVVAGYADNGTKLADYLTIRRSDGRASFAAAVQLKSYTTAGRPSAATLGAGASVYDTTLGKPVWSDGSAWKDAAGTVV